MQETETSTDIKEEILENNEEKEDEKNLVNSNEEDLEDEIELSLGSFDEAPKFMQDNEFIKRGYLLNCTTFKKTFKSLFMWHNETINIWSHLLGAIFFFALIFFTTIFITNYDSQLKEIKKDISNIERKTYYLYQESPYILNNTYNLIKEIKNHFQHFNKNSNYRDSLSKIINLCNEIKNLTSSLIDSISSSFKEAIISIKKSIFLIKEKILNLIKLDSSISGKLALKLDNEFNTNLKNRKSIELARWPLFVIIHSAILLFIFSASFHSLGTINERYHDILSRFDYGGISLLISGSCYPPYYYFFYYAKTFKYIYLSEITVFGIGIFLYSLTDDFNKPQKRSLRGIIFLIFGLCTGIPILHMAFFGDNLEGYGPGIKLLYWYLGGVSYVLGAILYIIRFPEKIFPMKFDYIGASHQIFHILVFFGALFHFLGSLDAYNYRFKNLKFNYVE